MMGLAGYFYAYMVAKSPFIIQPEVLRVGKTLLLGVTIPLVSSSSALLYARFNKLPKPLTPSMLGLFFFLEIVGAGLFSLILFWPLVLRLGFIFYPIPILLPTLTIGALFSYYISKKSEKALLLYSLSVLSIFIIFFLLPSIRI